MLLTLARGSRVEATYERGSYDREHRRYYYKDKLHPRPRGWGACWDLRVPVMSQNFQPICPAVGLLHSTAKLTIS